ncbi:MAG TPA: hypothetical protein PLR96_13660, partial [Flavobacteriales bacterium]|nr:hypothetical protein [Flavobacteriales bacterium]
GLLCYESALLLLPLAFIAARWRITEQWGQLRVGLILPFIAGSLFVVLRAWKADANGYIIGTLLQHPLLLFANAPKVLARLFLPPATDPSLQLLRGALLATAILIGIVWWLRSKHSKIARQQIVVWCLSILVGCSVGYIAGVSTTTSESDRFLYLPSAFLCGLLGMVIPMITNRTLRHGTVLFLVAGCVILLKQNHANWTEASRITRLCLDELPPAPQHGARWVYGLPGDHQGAFIFRNGFPEAVALAGGNADQMVVVPPEVGPDEVLISGLVHRGMTRNIQAGDVFLIWQGSGYSARWKD